jgi:hypothetical protein
VGAEVDWAAFGAAGLARLRAGEADLQSLDFAQPAFWLGFGDPGAQVGGSLRDGADGWGWARASGSGWRRVRGWA